MMRRIGTAIVVSAAVAYYAPSVLTPDFSHVTAREEAELERIRAADELKKYNDSILGLMQKYPALSYDDIMLLNTHTDEYEIRQYTLKPQGEEIASYKANLARLLIDDGLHLRLTWPNYDQLPDEVRNPTLDRLFDKYGLVLEPQFEVDRAALGKIPEPVLLAKYMLEIKKWTSHWNNIKQPRDEHLLTDMAIAIMLKESFATKAGMIPGVPDPSLAEDISKKDVGLFQISPWARNYLRRTKEFRQFKDTDFLKPSVSIPAGTYWIRQCMQEAKDNLMVAFGCYNKGIKAAASNELGSVAYRESVIDRFRKYLIEGYSNTFNYALSRANNKSQNYYQRTLQSGK